MPQPRTSPVLLARHGQPAREALAAAISAAKGDDPFAPVTVAVPSGPSGLSLRRSLARINHGAGTGFVNIRFSPLAPIIDRLGSPTLAATSRRPLTASMNAVAVRMALGSDPGPFHEFIDNPATARALETTLGNLRQLPLPLLHAFQNSSDRSAYLVSLMKRADAIVIGFYDLDEVALAGASAVRSGDPATDEIGHFIIFLPQDITAGTEELLDAFNARGLLQVIVGTTGTQVADAPALELAERLAKRFGVNLQSASSAPEESGAPNSLIIVAPDPESETRAIVRRIAAEAALGTPLHRVAVLYRHGEPYARLIRERLGAAQIPYNGPAPSSLADCVVGSAAIALCELAVQLASAGGISQDAISEFRIGAPLVDSVRAILADSKRAIQHVSESLAPPSALSWSGYSAWLRDLIDHYLGPIEHWATWSSTDQAERGEDVMDLLCALASNDALSQNLRNESSAPEQDAAVSISIGEFSEAVNRSLETQPGHTGKFGTGVHVGRLRDAIGADFDVVYVVGMNHGSFPPRPWRDPFLANDSDSVEGLGPSRGKAHEEHEYRGALAAAPRRVLSYSRSDLRAGRASFPSRWLLEEARAHCNNLYVSAETLESLETDPSTRNWLSVVGSLAQASSSAGPFESEQELRLALLARRLESGESITSNALVGELDSLRTGLLARSARAGKGGDDAASRSGLVRSRQELLPDESEFLSATGLAGWASCPFSYFLSHVLNVEVPESIDPDAEFSGSDRGGCIHEILERFIAERKPRTPDEKWSAADRDRIGEIAAEVFVATQASGITGNRAAWEIEQVRILATLNRVLDADEEVRTHFHCVPEATEQGFGYDDDPGLAIALRNGIELKFRGKIDRVDLALDKQQAVIFDYKTGAKFGDHLKEGLAEDPLMEGTHLQLAIYGLAAKQLYPQIDSVYSAYWLTTKSDTQGIVGYEVNDEVEDRLGEVLGAITSGIGGGGFAPYPGDEKSDGFSNCDYCDYERVCPSARDKVWEGASLDPRSAPFRSLALSAKANLGAEAGTP